MKKKWTVIFIVHAIDTTDIFMEYAEALKKMVCTIPLNGLENIHLLYLENTYVNSPDTAKRPIEARLYERKNTGIGNKGILEPIENFGVINIGSYINLGDIMNFVNDKYESEHFLLSTWDHGAGFGIWEQDPIIEVIKASFTQTKIHLTDDEIKIQEEVIKTWELKKEFFFKKNLSPETGTGASKIKMVSNRMLSGDAFTIIDAPEQLSTTKLNVFNKTFKENISGKATETDMLTNEELANAIKRAFGHRKIDVLVMMNCLMQMFETGYALKDCVRYLVGSESLCYVYGFYYEKLLQQITDHPETRSSAIAQLCVDTVKDKYDDLHVSESFEDVCISSVNLLYAQKVKDSLDRLVRIFGANFKERYNSVNISRSSLIDFFPPPTPDHFGLNSVDLMDFLYRLQKTDRSFSAIYREIKSLIMDGRYIMSKNMGEKLKRPGNADVDLANGISIYFPNDPVDTQSDEYIFFYHHGAKFECDFSREALWSVFLSSYLYYLETR